MTGIDKTNDRTCTWQGHVILTLMPDPHNTQAQRQMHTHTHARAMWLTHHSEQLQCPNQPNPPDNLSSFNLNKGEIIDFEGCVHVCLHVDTCVLEREKERKISSSFCTLIETKT